MQKNELITVLERLEEHYRNFYSGADKERILNAWYPFFADDDPAEVTRAVIIYICTEKYNPTIAGIKTIMADNRMAGQMTEMQAWSKIRKAIDNANSREAAYAEYGKLPPILQKIVCDPSRLRSWRTCGDDTLEGVIASNIQRSYRELAKREAVFYAIPGQLQADQAWRVDAPEQIALPEPLVQKSIADIVDEANAKAAEHGMTMTAELQEKHKQNLDAFFSPMTAEEKKIIEKRETAKAERYLK